jgi:DNA (cytosine-5)-methyltransferase 1
LRGGQLARCLTTRTRIDAETETLIPTIGGVFVDPDAGSGIAGTLQANGKAAGSATQQDAENGLLLPMLAPYTVRDVAGTLTSNYGKQCDSSDTALGPNVVMQPIAFSFKDHGADASYDLASTLRAGTSHTSHANSGQPPAIAFTAVDYKEGTFEKTDIARALTTSADRSRAAPICVTGDITHTLKADGFDASEDGTGRGQPIVAHAIQAGALRTNPNSGPDGVGVQEEVAYTLEARAEVQCAQHGMAVRRLTPRECERLQAYPDDYTLIPWRELARLQKKAAKHGVSFESVLRERGKIIHEPAGDECPDGPRYKALGNSMCTTKMAWLGRRIDRAVTEGSSDHEREIARVA